MPSARKLDAAPDLTLSSPCSALVPPRRHRPSSLPCVPAPPQRRKAGSSRASPRLDTSTAPPLFCTATPSRLALWPHLRLAVAGSRASRPCRHRVEHERRPKQSPLSHPCFALASSELCRRPPPNLARVCDQLRLAASPPTCLALAAVSIAAWRSCHHRTKPLVGGRAADPRACAVRQRRKGEKRRRKGRRRSGPPARFAEPALYPEPDLIPCRPLNRAKLSPVV
ncbi:hypothetical protein PVAP13_2KG271400 [Panicum virgatum]|uniref:Uncharacterized protein n=1 Tax=Panicum virgatum TaxID=38727 RepID=A0A8T0W4Y8_PANVG|nr:hypothetical protein PVAP13_2KG271400 [Panicum virgatum]